MNMLLSGEAMAAEREREIALRRRFKKVFSSEDGREIVRELFERFSGPPSSAENDLSFLRHVGRLEVLNFILDKGAVLERNEHGQ
jgi:hypothetical protein